MIKPRIGMANSMGLTVVVALNLALFRGVTELLSFPAVLSWLVLLDLALARLLIWRKPLRPAEYGFILFGFVATIVTFPYNTNPRLLRATFTLFGKTDEELKMDQFLTIKQFTYAERATLGGLILVIALCGGALVGRGHRRRKSRREGADRINETS